MAIDPSETVHDNYVNNFDELCEILGLSPSEILVGQLFFLEGLRQSDIADRLDETTVEVRRIVSNMYAKIRVHFGRPSSL